MKVRYCDLIFQLDQHDKALEILVHKLENHAAAERYCMVSSQVSFKFMPYHSFLCLPNTEIISYDLTIRNICLSELFIIYEGKEGVN